ncbi:hypothetical protein Aph01nite_39890 [Acrocarpospora phusangensis]|uniref:DUF305 domain-containing protein n=1 Tax=Acrocarpospora phusangensis TaxID=1070424 RepID=A0A919QAP6_9ACTN|nr:DUF305 domain-containing protein [Acrocarpospora phusangensis]GIH25679.1 hypothetical protein Aph01nite_39890 [Acrocarpospora phusangensis]
MTTYRWIAVPVLMALLTACSQETPAAAPASPPATAETSAAASPPAASSPAATPEAEPSATAGAEASPAAAVTTPAAGYNDADVTFAASMIPHHLQALDLTQLAATRADDLWVRDLAGRVRSQREPEIRLLKGLLDGWGEEPLPRDHDLPGGVSKAEMDKLAAASGAAFDRMFVTLLIAHHEGALTLARAEQEQGAHADAKAMAGGMVVTQESELKEMKKYLTRLKK